MQPNPQPRQTTYVQPVGVIPGLKSVIGQTGQQVNIALGGSDPDAYQILQILDSLGQQFARMPIIRESAVRIVGRASDNDTSEQLRTILEFIRNNVKYVRDPSGSEYVISPLRMLQQIASGGYSQGDCDDHVLLFNSLVGSLGFAVRPVGVHLYSQSVFDHVISQVMYNSRWIDVDPCQKSGETPTYASKLVIQ